MTATSDDHIALAAEYALGTLEADERAQAETMMSLDKDFAAEAESWAYRLGVLNQMVGAVEPRPVVWENIKSAIAKAEPQAPLTFPEPPLPPPSEGAAAAGEPAPEPGEPRAAPAEPVAPAVDNSTAVPPPAHARRWRGIAGAAAVLAAALAALAILQIVRPALLPEALRPAPRTEVVEVKVPAPAPAPVPSAQYVAVLQGESGGPGFILTVDGATRHFTLRRVGAPAPDPGKAYELWLMSDKLPQPRALGVISGSLFTTGPFLTAYATDVIDTATYAISLEQAGGAPDGAPHAPTMFKGKLIQTVPAVGQGEPTKP